MNNYKTISYAKMGERTTVCVITCLNGYEVSGSFCCKADMVNNDEFRESKAFENAEKVLNRNRQKRIQNEK